MTAPQPADGTALLASEGCDAPRREKSFTRSSSKEESLSSRFWAEQTLRRPNRIILVRHAESEGNSNRSITQTVPDHALHLTAIGRKQALAAGRRIHEIIGDETVKFVVSSYVRTRETLNGILQSFKDRDCEVLEDIRIREQEHGNFDSKNMSQLHKTAQHFGLLYFRFPDGESAADCYDRASLFLESTYRRWANNTCQNEVIVSHGTMLKVIIMRLLRIAVAEFGNIDPLDYCELVVLERLPSQALFEITYTWRLDQEKDFQGLRSSKTLPDVEMWDGDPDAPLLVSKAAPISTVTPGVDNVSKETKPNNSNRGANGDSSAPWRIVAVVNGLAFASAACVLIMRARLRFR